MQLYVAVQTFLGANGGHAAAAVQQKENKYFFADVVTLNFWHLLMPFVLPLTEQKRCFRLFKTFELLPIVLLF